MKNKILFYVSIIFSAFLFIDCVSATSCEYGYAARDADGITYDKRITINYNEGNYSFDYDESPDLSKCTPDSTNDSKSYDCWDNQGEIHTYYTWELSIPAQISSTYFENNDCPPMVFRYEFSSGNVTGFFNTGILYTFTEEISLDDEDKWWEIFSIDNKTSEIYVEKSKAEDGFTSEDAAKEHCLFWESYYVPLTMSIQESGNSCEDNQEFSKLYQDLTDRCSRYLGNFGYTTSDEIAETENGSLSASTCAKRCSGLRDTVAILCKSTPKEGCNGLGDHLLNWIYRMIKFVRYAIPALLIILSILDFIKAIASESDDEIKKVSSRFTKRLIAAALIFIAPFILDFILKMFNIPGLNDPFCVE